MITGMVGELNGVDHVDVEAKNLERKCRRFIS